jgi:hypothetical protein
MMEDAAGSLRVREQLQRYLRPGEELLWYGRPDPSVLFTLSDFFFIPFGFVWLAQTIRVEIQAFVMPDSALLCLVAFPFLALGLYLTFGRFVVKRRRKAETAYGITRDRAIIVTGPVVLEKPIVGSSVLLRRSRDGRHLSVVFGPAPYISAPWVPGRILERLYGRGGFGNTGLEPLFRPHDSFFAFYDVADPDALQAAIYEAQPLPKP